MIEVSSIVCKMIEKNGDNSLPIADGASRRQMNAPCKWIALAHWTGSAQSELGTPRPPLVCRKQGELHDMENRLELIDYWC